MVRRFISAILVLSLWVGMATAQQLLQSPILTIDPERFYLESSFGKSVLAEIETRNQKLLVENRRLEAELEEEERALKDQRPTMEPEAFRALADAFDGRVQEIRQQRDAEARAISELLENSRAEFLVVAGPVLETLMRELGSAVVLDVNNVYASANAIDITDRAIEGVNQLLTQNEPVD